MAKKSLPIVILDELAELITRDLFQLGVLISGERQQQINTETVISKNRILIYPKEKTNGLFARCEKLLSRFDKGAQLELMRSKVSKQVFLSLKGTYEGYESEVRVFLNPKL